MYYILNASHKDAIRYLKKSNASYEDATCPLIFGPDLLGLKLKFQIIAIKTVILQLGMAVPKVLILLSEQQEM